MLDQLTRQAGRYAVEYGDDVIYAFRELPQTPAGQALQRQAQQILSNAGITRITWGIEPLVRELELLLH